MKSEKAKKYIDDDAIMMRNGDRMVDASTAYMAIELAEQEMEEKLTRWIPVEEQKLEIGKLVLAKVSDDDGTTYGVVEYVGPGVWGLPFGFVPDDSLPTHWREIF